jgi:hypothetical protein
MDVGDVKMGSNEGIVRVFKFKTRRIAMTNQIKTLEL